MPPGDFPPGEGWRYSNVGYFFIRRIIEETTGYGLGLMTGCMSMAGPAIGHSGGGPGSVCAVYHFPERDSPCTAAAFAQGEGEGVPEHEVDRLAAR